MLHFGPRHKGNIELCPNIMNLSQVSNPPKKRFQFSAGLNLEKFNAILSGTNLFEPQLIFKLRLKIFKFDLRPIAKFTNFVYSGINEVYISSRQYDKH